MFQLYKEWKLMHGEEFRENFDNALETITFRI